MDFLLNYSWVRWEVGFLAANAAYLVFHVTWGIWRGLARALVGAVRWHRDVRSAAVVIPAGPAVQQAPVAALPAARAELNPDQKQKLQDAVVAAKSKISRADWESAQSKIVEGLSIDKFNVELNCMLAEQFERRQEWRKAEFIYKDLILATDSAESALYVRLAVSLAQQEKLELALEVYKKAFSLKPDDARTAETIARLALALGSFEDAKKYAKEALRVFPRNSKALDVLAAAHVGCGERKDALEAYRKMKELDPYDPALRKTIERVALEVEMEQHMNPASSPDAPNA